MFIIGLDEAFVGRRFVVVVASVVVHVLVRPLLVIVWRLMVLRLTASSSTSTLAVRLVKLDLAPRFKETLDVIPR
jgi:type IV secretory pathway TrbL component